MIEGKVGNRKLVLNGAPRGKTGEIEITLDGRIEKVKWIRDDQGIWIESSSGCHGYDVRKFVNDDGQASYQLLGRKKNEFVNSVSFLKAGEECDASASQKVKKVAKIKSQMPGKIVRILAKAGDAVKKGQSVMVMEAMKMENEIKAAQDGTIKDIKVTEGQAVETGAELLTFV